METGERGIGWKTRTVGVVPLVAAALALNWVWETLHAVAFVESSGTLSFRLWHCLPMAVVDAGWTLALWAAVGGLDALPRRFGVRRLTALGVLGAVTAVALELFALDGGRWTYNSLMPIVPVINVGLWPVLQMAILPVVTVRLNDWWKG